VLQAFAEAGRFPTHLKKHLGNVLPELLSLNRNRYIPLPLLFRVFTEKLPPDGRTVLPARNQACCITKPVSITDRTYKGFRRESAVGRVFCTTPDPQ
jgi:hypothetical protein